MARPHLRSPSQSWPTRLVLGVYEFAASLKLAVILLLGAAAVLAAATFVEAQYGLRAVHFGIYGTWWFTLLNALLAINIFCAAAIRYPWKRYQTGFVITHIGLLTLMFGMLLSRRGGIDAQMVIWEDQQNYRAMEDSEHFELEVASTGAPSDETEDKLAEIIPVPFTAGPFNWRDYDTLPLPFWRWAHRDQGVLYDQDGIRLELLDYYSNSRQVQAPYLKLKITNPRRDRVDDQGRHVAGPESFSAIELNVRPVDERLALSRPAGLGDRQTIGGGNIVFWLATSPAEVEAFLNSAPEGELGPRGQVVVSAAGKTFRFGVEEHLHHGRFPLGDSGLEAEVVRFLATARLSGKPSERLELVEASTDGKVERPAIEVQVFGTGAEPARLMLFADLPEFSEQAPGQGVFGSYWFDYGEKSTAEIMQGERGSRIDIVQAPGGKLHYRYWNRHQVAKIAPLPTDGQLVDAFKMPIAQLRMKVDELVASDRPQTKVLPVAFSRDMTAPDANRAARVRLTVDGHSDEFWLVGPRLMFVDQPVGEMERHTVAGQDRQVVLRMPLDEIDVGFQVRLRKFSRKLDPGTSTPSHYGSVIDILDRNNASDVLERNVEISMNAPIDFSDPESGRSYRLFQESFRGPFGPDSGLLEMVYRGPAGPPREAKYTSVLTVNYDPGRGVKYVGCLLIVAGIATMFYMRAYFFKRPGTADSAPRVARDNPVELVEAGV